MSLNDPSPSFQRSAPTSPFLAFSDYPALPLSLSLSPDLVPSSGHARMVCCPGGRGRPDIGLMNEPGDLLLAMRRETERDRTQPRGGVVAVWFAIEKVSHVNLRSSSLFYLKFIYVMPSIFLYPFVCRFHFII